MTYFFPAYCYIAQLWKDCDRMPTTIFQERMFRHKPYTNCHQCIQSSQIKCRNCMAQLIDAIIQQKTSPTSPTKENQRRLFARTECSEAKVGVRSGRRMAAEEEFEVETNFGRWIRKVKNKNTNRSVGMFQQWPHKKMANCQKLQKLQIPKFESWEGRLLNRFQKNEACLKILRDSKRMR